MSDYIRREDAINALEEKEHEPWYLHKDLEWISGVVEAKDKIKAIEPADVVPVVRCCDCKHWKSYWGRCYKHDEYGMASDDFCSYGERREG